MKRDHRGEGEIALFVSFALFIAAGFWIYNNYIKSQWSIIYEKPNEVIAYKMGNYSSRDECLSALQAVRYNSANIIGPECGKNCDPPKSIYGAYVCKETAD